MPDKFCFGAAWVPALALLPATQSAAAPVWQSLKYSVTATPGAGAGEGDGEGEGAGEGAGDGAGEGDGLPPTGGVDPSPEASEPPPPQAATAASAQSAKRRVGKLEAAFFISGALPNQVFRD